MSIVCRVYVCEECAARYVYDEWFFYGTAAAGRGKGGRGLHDQGSRAGRGFHVDERRHSETGANAVTTKQIGQEQLAVMSRSKSVRASSHPPLPSTMPGYKKERASSGGEYMRHQLQAWSGCTHGQNCVHCGRAFWSWAGGATLPPVGVSLVFGRAVRLGRAAPGAPPWSLPGATPFPM